jgi:hypothetical protein
VVVVLLVAVLVAILIVVGLLVIVREAAHEFPLEEPNAAEYPARWLWSISHVPNVIKLYELRSNAGSSRRSAVLWRRTSSRHSRPTGGT